MDAPHNILAREWRSVFIVAAEIYFLVTKRKVKKIHLQLTLKMVLVEERIVAR